MTIDWLDNAYKLAGKHKRRVDACSKARGFLVA
jgi:hypothetical protein